MLTRRQMIKIGLLGGSALAIPNKITAMARSASPVLPVTLATLASPTVTPFSVPLPIPPVLAPTSTDLTTDYYSLTPQTAVANILPGLQTPIWAYNGIYPGPTIRAKSGRRVVVRHTNMLPESLSMHLHGGHTPPDSDGHPNILVSPGSYKDYDYPNNQIPATLWYHDHAVDATGRHVYMGLAGFYIMYDDYETGLNLPSGSNDVPLLIQDRQFNSDGSLNYTLTDKMIVEGFMGDTILVNGAVQPNFDVGKRKVRFRILNGSNSRIYKLALSIVGSRSTGSFKQIGSDGGLLSAPVTRSTISLASAERLDVVIDFSGYPLGTQLILQNQNESSSNLSNIMRFTVARNEADTSVIPSTLRTVTRMPESLATTSRLFELTKDTVNGRSVWLINGKLYDPARIDVSPRLNAVEVWTLYNRSSEIHPIHIHDIEWQILDINGQSPGPGDSGWKDVFQVPAWKKLRVIGRFTDHLGKYVMHCHKLEHEDHAMMAQFEVVP